MTAFSVLAVLADHGRAWNHDGWWPLWPLLWIGVLAAAVWFVARRTGDRRRPDPFDRAREILAERLASGDITAEEYRERLEQLR